MRARPLIVTLSAAALLVSLAGSLAPPAIAQAQTSASKLSPATQRLLKENQLQRLAKQEPAQAIRQLDELRAEADHAAVGRAIAEVASRAGGQAPANEAVGLFLRAAVETYPEVLASEGSSGAVALHRSAVEGLIVALQQVDESLLEGNTVAVAGPLTDFALSWVNAAEDWIPATHQFIPASHYGRVKTKAQGRRQGIGVPVVAWRKDGAPGVVAPEGGVFPSYLFSYPLTAVFEPGDSADDSVRQARLRFVDPRLSDTYRLGEVDHPLAMDIGAQVAALSREIDLQFGKKGALHSGKYLGLVGLYLLEPLRDDKIPVVMVHGLVSSIKTWAPAYDAVALEPELLRRYQFSFFTYPSGLPWAYSATLLRRALVRMLGNGSSAPPLHRRTMVIGHSMGGLLARMQTTDSGEVLWNGVFDKPPEELDLSPRDSQFVREILFVEPFPLIERMVFCSTPHRGSDTAGKTVGKMGASVIKLPDELREVGKGIVTDAPDDLTGKAASRRKFPDSVQSMQPDHDLILALDQLPVAEGVRYHSIIGDRGKGNTPDSSDGVVPYWSSHLDGAESEKIVPSGHSSQANPEGIEEIVRILYLHLDEQ